MHFTSSAHTSGKHITYTQLNKKSSNQPLHTHNLTFITFVIHTLAIWYKFLFIFFLFFYFIYLFFCMKVVNMPYQSINTWKKNSCKYTLISGHVHGYKHETTSKSNSAYILCAVTFVWKYQMCCRNGAIGHLAMCSTVIWLHTYHPLTTPIIYSLFYALIIELVAEHT